MANVILLFGSIVICLTIGIIGFILLKKGHKIQKAEYRELWEQFQSLKNDESTIKIQEILKIANELVFNKYIPTEHLEIILEYCKEKELSHPEFKILKANTYNKWINHTHGYPSGNGIF